MTVIDTHAHLNMDEFDSDLDQVILRAKEVGVQKILVIGIDEPSNRKAIELSKQYDMLYATVGVHPGSVDHADTRHLEEWLKEDKVVAIGECGLDFYWTTENKDIQVKVFLEQIRLAEKTGLPLVIHTRNSFDEAYHMLLPFKGKVRGVFHCFSSDLKDAKRAIDLGFMIGLDGPVTYKNHQVLKEIIEHIDLKHILIETDAPYMAPVPYRGKRNEPSYVYQVVKKIAEIKAMSETDVIGITTQNAIKCFNIGGFTR